MSPSWLDRLLAPVILRISANAATIFYRGETMRHGPDADDGETPAWKRCLRNAERDLAALRLPRLQRRARVVVGNDLVRYAVLPWTEQRLDAAERLQYARMLFEERYGRDHGSSEIAMEMPRFGMPSLAAAIDADVVDELKVAMARCGLRVSALIPAIADRLSVCREQLRGAQAGWVADAADGQLVTLAFADGRWLRVSSQRRGDDHQSLDARLLESLRRDAIAFPALLDGHVLLAGAAPLDGVAEWPVVSLGVTT